VKLVKTAGKFVKSLFGKKEGDKNEKTNDVRDVAGNAMADLVGSETTPEQAQNAAQSISQQLAPQGLRRVYLGVPDEEGNTPIFAEASPPKRVRILARKRVTVSVEAKIQVSGAPALEGLNQTGFAQFDKERAAAMGGTGKAAMLPEVSQPPGVSAKHGTQRSSGMVLEPKAGSRSIEVVAWNTGQKILQHNPSHAEKQFIEWFWSRPKAWRERVTSVSVIISGREICDYCMGDIKNVESGHPWIHFFWLRGDADKKKDKKSEKLDVKK
jgi:hypothetical protein